MMSVYWRHTKKSLLVICMVLYSSCHLVQARQNTSNGNFIGVSFGGGYSSMIDFSKNTRNVGSWNVLAGVNYEYRLTHFYFTTGVEISALNTDNTFVNRPFDHLIMDTQGKKAMLHYNFYPQSDEYEFLFVGIPFTLGYHYEGFYVGGGLKADYCVQSKVISQMSYETSATYEQYISDFTDMSNHFYSENRSAYQKELSTKFNVSVLAEAGYDVLKHVREQYQADHHILRIGIFAEMGIVPIIRDKVESQTYRIDNVNPIAVHIYPMYMTDKVSSYRVLPISAGIKLSWLFNVDPYHCNCY